MSSVNSLLDRIPSCPVCFEHFDVEWREPRVDPACGQSICYTCYQALKVCPICRADYPPRPIAKNVALIDWINDLNAKPAAKPAAVAAKVLEKEVQVFAVLHFPNNECTKTVTIEIRLSDTCTSLVEMVSKKLGVETAVFSLIFKGRAMGMWTEGTLREFGVQKEDTLIIHFNERYMKKWIANLNAVS